MTAHALHWRHGQARVLTTAAMLAECAFHLPGGPFAPFARAPWMGRVTDPAFAGHLRELGGDFVCLPFGRARAIPCAPPDWAPMLTVDGVGHVHGPAADQDWIVTSASDSAITLALDYPAASGILRIERTIAARPDAPALDFAWTIHALAPLRVAVGLHPILRLPDAPGRLHLSADFAFGLIHPGQTPPGTAQGFASLSAVPGPGGPVDLAHVPLAPRTDLNVQLCGLRGPLTARYLDEGAGVVLDWDRTLLPSLQIWHTDGGISGPPWHGQFRGIGVEPVASAFDLGNAVSTGPNPIAARGIATAIALDPAAPLTIRHSIAAFALGDMPAV